MKTLILFFLLFMSLKAVAAPEPFISCLSSSNHIKAINIYMTDSKGLPDVYSGKLPACTFKPSPNGPLVMSVTYPAVGSTITGSDGKPVTFWMAAVVVDQNNKSTIYYQYSDFISRSTTLENPTPCTQGLFISDQKRVLDFKSNEPSQGLGRASLKGEELILHCQSK